ncbi:MAG: DUF1573 domain-containing protein [Phaeodactylibacter sp.]|nr:DUF1573 domain-containing protein [Phaeodactylibacter sp.]MCB9300248.1 DUF1573 domain-containing protein [Lewinellaceae bacterium]HQU59691.1 DUF1573 domain-containing protein [Saprospiraceae bacterium]
MKKLLSVLAMLSLVVALGYSQNETATPQVVAETEQDGPVMAFETETVDYGVIEQGSEPFRVFKFTNTGNAPLIITNAKGSCGCTVPTYPKEPIGPGESSEIKVRYDTNRLGKFTKRVTLTTNVGTEQKMLTITGEVIKKPEEPAGLPANEGSLFNNN